MHACHACSGFVPAHLGACPHCATAARPSRWGRVARALTAALGAGAAMMTLAACYGAPAIRDTCVDMDGDGWFPACYDDLGTCDPDDANCDCDDGDPNVNPGAFDPPDGLDRDCDGKDGQRPGGPAPDAWEAVPDAFWQDDAPWPEIDARPPDGGPDAGSAPR